MSDVTDKILLNDLLRLNDLRDVKVRLMKYAGQSGEGVRQPDFIKLFQDGEREWLMRGLFWNYGRNRSFREGQTVVGLAEMEKGRWLLFAVCRVTKDLDRLNDVGYEYEALEEYGKYLGRVVVRYRNSSQNLIRKAAGIMDHLEVEKILPAVFNDDIFPGYENVNLSFDDMRRNVEKDSWRTALQNQKGVYLITDTKNGKPYVGSAYGDTMLLGRWRGYIKTGHGGNAELRALVAEKGFEYIKRHFRYSILEIFKSTVDDRAIIERESWWKNALLSREFGYNRN